MRYVHRLAYMWHHGVVIESHQHVMHTCDNPPCFNPAHLSLGTHGDNMLDKARKLRCATNTLVPTQVLEIKVRLANGKRGTGRALAKEYGVHEMTISDIKRGLTWDHVK